MTVRYSEMKKPLVVAMGAILLAFSLLNKPVQADEGGVYSAYDNNADGYLDEAEFELFLKKRRVKPEYRHLWIFDKVDVDGDRRISNRELVDTLQQELQLRSQRKK